LSKKIVSQWASNKNAWLMEKYTPNGWCDDGMMGDLLLLQGF
jgi:hypothetical protein